MCSSLDPVLSSLEYSISRAHPTRIRAISGGHLAIQRSQTRRGKVLDSRIAHKKTRRRFAVVRGTAQSEARPSGSAFAANRRNRAASQQRSLTSEISTVSGVASLMDRSIGFRSAARPSGSALPPNWKDRANSQKRSLTVASLMDRSPAWQADTRPSESASGERVKTFKSLFHGVRLRYLRRRCRHLGLRLHTDRRSRVGDRM